MSDKGLSINIPCSDTRRSRGFGSCLGIQKPSSKKVCLLDCNADDVADAAHHTMQWGHSDASKAVISA